MSSTQPTRPQLLHELSTLRQRVAQLEADIARQSGEQRYQHVIEHTFALICIHDLEGTLLTINPAAAQALGYHPEEGVGRNLRDFLAPAVQHLFEDYLVRLREQAVDNGVMRLVTKQGDERLWQYHNVRYDEPGHTSYVIGYAQDITDRIRAERALREAHHDLERQVQARTQELQDINAQLRQEIVDRQRAEDELRNSEARYRDLFENASDVVYVHDMDGNFLAINHAAELLGGYPCDEVLRMNILDIIVPEHRALLEQMRAGHASQHSTPTYELDILTKAGRRVTLEVNPRLIMQHGEAVAVQGIARDITLRKRLEGHLRQAQTLDAIGTLAGGIAHNFNNILMVILGFIELALDTIPQHRPGWQHLQNVLVAGERAKNLVRQMVTFSRYQAPSRVPTHLPPLLQDTLDEVQATLPPTIALHIHLCATQGLVLADPAHIRQIVLHLCSNAVHAMRLTGGALTVALEAVDITLEHPFGFPELQPGPHLLLTVQDTGHGIAPPILDHIFEPFFTTKEPNEGIGMGLAVVHGIVLSHGGTVTVESREGEGTRMLVYLPCLEEPAHA